MRVELSHRFTPQRHMQQAVFPMRPFVGDEKVVFSCAGLGTWTPTWGGIESWNAEIGFDLIRLKIPTFMTYEILGLGLIGELPLVGEFARRLLRGTVPGIAGYSEYEQESRWKMVITRPEKKGGMRPSG